MSDIPKFKNASEITAYLEELYKDADMMEDDQKILRYEKLGIEMIEMHKDPEFRADWEEKNQVARQIAMANPEYRKIRQLATAKLHNTPESRYLWEQANLKRYSDPDYLEKWKASVKKVTTTPEYREKNRAASQKANSKPISCDGVIYLAKNKAATALAPKTRLSIQSKMLWISEQIKKYPERYFYIVEDDK